MAPYSSTLAWKIPWTEEPGRPQSMGLLRVSHDWATSLSLFTFMHWRRKWQPTPVFLLENPRDGGAWWAAIYGVTQSQTRLKRLSSSSSSMVKRRYITDFLIEGWRWEAIINYINEKRMIMLKAAKTCQRFRIGIHESGNEGYLPIPSVGKSYQKNK